MGIIGKIINLKEKKKKKTEKAYLENNQIEIKQLKIN